MNARFFSIFLIGISAIQLSLRAEDWGWTATNFQTDGRLKCGTTISDSIFLAVRDADVEEKHSIYQSIDQGNTWFQISTLNGLYLKSMVSDSSGAIFISLFDPVSRNSEVRRSMDMGVNWEDTSPLPADAEMFETKCSLYHAEDDSLFVFGIFDSNTHSGIARSTDRGKSWISLGSLPEEVLCITSFIRISNEIFIAGDLENRMLGSTDSGRTWTIVYEGLTSYHEVTTIVSLPSIRSLAGRLMSTELISSENGFDEWNSIAVLDGAGGIRSIYRSPTHGLFAGTESGNTIYRSLDSGLTWEGMWINVASSCVRSFIEDAGGTLFALTDGRLLRFEIVDLPPTPTPNPAPPTPRPTPTAVCETLGAFVEIPLELLHPGDLFFLNIKLCNNLHFALENNPLFLVFEYQGNFWFAPGWKSELNCFMEKWPVGEITIPVIEPFVWPVTGNKSDGTFYCAITDSSMKLLVGEIDIKTISWEE